MTKTRKIKLESMNIAQEKRVQFKKLFPEVFSEDKIDYELLKRILGDEVEHVARTGERFGLSWPGKSECLKIIQQPSIATLRPSRGESIDFDNTENLFIEGENLEVLKLLQKSYFGKIKVIYIDPPYNTGKEFIYPDKYGESMAIYLAYTGQVDDKGRRFSTNTDTVGRYHSNWLNMMYSRLYLARNLLREDGVIFINIDDNELHNLISLCGLIFGEENFAGLFPWRSRTAKADVPYGVSKDVEWVVCYCKQDFVAGRSGKRKYYKSDDYEDRWRLQDLTTNKTKDERPNSYFTMINPKNRDKYPASKTRTWSVTQETFQGYYDKGKIVFPGDYDFLNIKKPAFRVFESEDKQKALKKYSAEDVKMSVSTYLPEKDVRRTEHGSKEIRELFGAQVFSYPKPTGLIKFFVNSISDPEAVVMDFFAGSGTTADAVMRLNAEDGGSRKFILVQLPEPLDPKSKEQKTAAEYCKANKIPLNISALCQERIRRVVKDLSDEEGKNLDLGFKVFKLSESNFKVWEGNVEEISNLEERLFDHINHVKKDRTQEDILYELLLKSGFSLVARIEKIRLADKDVFSIEDGAMLICLDKELTQGVIEAMANFKPRRVICLDEGFKNNDQLKANAVQIFKSCVREEEREIVFSTV